MSVRKSCHVSGAARMAAARRVLVAEIWSSSSVVPTPALEIDGSWVGSWLRCVAHGFGVEARSCWVMAAIVAIVWGSSWTIVGGAPDISSRSVSWPRFAVVPGLIASTTVFVAFSVCCCCMFLLAPEKLNACCGNWPVFLVCCLVWMTRREGV